jgi:hypothetical protein
MLPNNDITIGKIRFQAFVYLCSPSTCFADQFFFEHSVKWSHPIPCVKVACFPWLVQAIEDRNPICSRGFDKGLHMSYCLSGLQAVFTEFVNLPIWMNIVIVRINEKDRSILVRHFKSMESYRDSDERYNELSRYGLAW